MTAKKKESTEKVFSKSDFLKMEEPEVKKVWIEGIEAYVYMKQMSATDQDSYEWSIMEFVNDEATGEERIERNMEAMRAKYLVRVLCDSKGKRLFTNDEYMQLGRKFPKIILELHRKALEVNRDDKDSLEEMRKNSDSEQKEDSTSD